MNTVITRAEYAKWIDDISESCLMLTISKPHAKTLHLNLQLEDMEPLISKIITLANSFVFGKYKHFDYLKGIVVAENLRLNPHFHILFKKPKNIDFDKFESKLTKLANKICDEKFKFDFTNSYLKSEVKYLLSNPGYCKFAFVSNVHIFTGNYLTKSYATYYVLSDRKISFANARINVNVIF